MSLPGNPYPLSLPLSVNAAGALGAFDGAPDLAGTSAQHDSGLTQTGTTALTLTGAADLAGFIGSGALDLALSVNGGSTINGPGNLLTRLLARAGAQVHISYAYLPNASAGVACFAAGTRIATEEGETPVQLLQIGHRVRSVLRGGIAPIVWIGHRQVVCDRHPRPDRAWPIRVVAGAFAPGMPARDLFLSPDHAVFVDDVLVPVRHLKNGTTIAQVPADSVIYYHVELDAHDVLLAEGLPAESYLNGGDRSAFANGGGVVQAYPDFNVLAWEAEGCAPLVVTGPILDAVRSRVERRARLLRRRRPVNSARAGTG